MWATTWVSVRSTWADSDQSVSPVSAEPTTGTMDSTMASTSSRLRTLLLILCSSFEWSSFPIHAWTLPLYQVSRIL